MTNLTIGQKEAAKALLCMWRGILFKYGVEQAKEFIDIYAKEGIEKAIEYKNKLGG